MDDNTMYDLIHDIYETDIPIRKIIEKYNLSVSPAHIYKLLPPIISDRKCPFCDTAMQADRKKRSGAQTYTSTDYYCPNCGHKLYNCHCKGCTLLKIEKEQKIKEEAINAYSSHHENISINDLSFEQKVYLGTLLQTPLSYGKTIFGPTGNNTLTLDREWDIQIIESLLSCSAISISEKSPTYAFSFVDNQYCYDYRQLKFKINLCSNDMQMLSNGNYLSEITEEDISTIKKICFRLYFSFVREYIIKEMQKCKFRYTHGPKSDLLINSMLELFSPSQSLRIISSCMDSASKRYLQEGISSSHAANSVISHAYNYINKAKEENWVINGFHRPQFLYECPLEIYLFYILMKDQDYFYKTIDKVFADNLNC